MAVTEIRAKVSTKTAPADNVSMSFFTALCVTGVDLRIFCPACFAALPTKSVSLGLSHNAVQLPLEL